METSDGASSISVVVRVRPFTIREAAQLTKTDDGPLFLGDGSLAAAPAPKLATKGLRSVIKVVDEKCLVFDPPEDNPMQRFSRSVVPQGKKVKDQTFMFDRVFDDNTSQSDVYEATTRNLLGSVLDGYNATVFAYGATGCGKTHTITGTAQQPGIIFLTMQELFERIQERQNEKVVEISLSYLEIYNETIRDLLIPGGSKQGLMLREDCKQAVSVSGLSSHHPKNVQEVMDMIVRGNEFRTMSPTEANATSSRSHAVLQINVSQKDRNADISEPHTMATLSIIDLAGSERASATKNRGERLIEGANINKSLLALGSCINALCDPRKRNHVPYRNSKLTRLLKFSLGGNCKTVMIVCVSPSSAHFDETQNTLRYANRAKNIQTKVTRNVYNVNRHVKDFLKKIDEQMALINELKHQQKDYEATAFVKFRKQNEKREGIAREGIARIRAAYEHSAAERQERTVNMKKLRQIERRISLISSWIAGFDTVCETREEEEPPRSLVAMRKTAQGILAELESSRQHYHQRLSKTTWDRSLETALQTGIRQLRELDGGNDSPEIATLSQETELLRSMADREAYTSMLDQEKGGDAALIQVLLQAHFDTIAILGQILQMSEEDGVQAAKKMLGKILSACSTATSQVIKPDGGLPVTEVFAPSKAGTPKHRKPVDLLGPSPVRPFALASIAEASNPVLASSSPSRGTPRRRKLGPAKKGVSFSPKKKSPVKVKRGVRWKDDTDDGPLAEFQATPKAEYSTPEASSTEQLPPPVMASLQPVMPPPSEQENSSPAPVPPQTFSDVRRPSSNRFQTGFLSKKSDGSPLSTLTSTSLLSFSSDSDTSPLRDLEINKAPHRHSHLNVVSNPSSDNTPADSGSNASSSDDEAKPRRRSPSTTPKQPGHASSWSLGRAEAKQIRSALKRTSSINGHGNSSANAGDRPVPRAHRRRSPTASNSPPAGTDNAATFPRRLVQHGGDKEWRGSMSSVLSPRTAPVLKGSAARRTTVGPGGLSGGSTGEEGGHARVPSGSGMRAGPVRMSTAGTVAAVGARGSVATAKNVWR